MFSGKQLLRLPCILVEIGEGHFTGTSIDVLDARRSLIVERAARYRRSVRQGDLILLAGDGAALLIDKFYFDPVLFVLVFGTGWIVPRSVGSG